MNTDSLHSLKSGSILNNFKIVRILGAGGFGITYLAKDLNLNLDVVIKEYFPNEFAVRNSDNTILPKTRSDADYAKGKLRFKEEAQILATFDHPSIVKILGYFEANNTAYFVMKHEDGMDLAQYIKEKGKPFTQDEILTIIMPILEGLKEVHRHNYLHRDIKPGNILLRKNNSPVLIDFGATRIAVNDEQSKSVTSMLTEGYAPFEQYSTDLKQQGPFTDIYAIGAVMYKMVTLETPIASQTRVFQKMQHGNDPLKKLSSMNITGYDAYFLKAIDKALSIKPTDREKNVGELQSKLIVKQVVKKSEQDNVSEKSTLKIVKCPKCGKENKIANTKTDIVRCLKCHYSIPYQTKNSKMNEEDGVPFFIQLIAFALVVFVAYKAISFFIQGEW